MKPAGTLKGASGALLCLLAAALLYVASALLVAPRIAALRWVEPGPTAMMRLRADEGIPPAGTGTGWTPLSGVAPSLLNAVLHAEDDRFPSHHGFDVERMRLAASSDLEEGRFARGASTITQQLAKNLFLSPARNPLRKLKEGVLTILIELAVPKPRILEAYVNVIEWGRGVYGVGAASRIYFGKAPAALTRSEAALLAATIPSPLVRNPGHVTRGLLRKQRWLLYLMSRRDVVPSGWTVAAP